jgi:hypothetical protein
MDSFLIQDRDEKQVRVPNPSPRRQLRAVKAVYPFGMVVLATASRGIERVDSNGLIAERRIGIRAPVPLTLVLPLPASTRLPFCSPAHQNRDTPNPWEGLEGSQLVGSMVAPLGLAPDPVVRNGVGGERSSVSSR